MTHDYSSRLARAAEESERSDLDALLITPGPDLLYLTGYDPPPLERLTALVIRRGSDPVLLVPELERPRAAASPANTLFPIETWGDGQDPYEAVRGLVPARGALGATDRMWASHLLALERAIPGVSFHSAGAAMSRLRARKDQGEVELLARAGFGTDEAFGRILHQGLRGRSEKEVAGSLAGHLLEAGLDSVAFTIVGSGPNGASPHHDPRDRIARDGDTVVLDFGGRVGGYCSDMTRTVSVGEPGAEALEIHAIVAEAQDAAFQAVRPGVPAQEIDRIARQIISSSGYGDRFFHRTGHGIGLEEHEDPYIVEGNTTPLEPGMCFSIEPGIYLEGRFGVRIEDIVAVTEAGAVRLNDAPRALTVVD